MSTTAVIDGFPVAAERCWCGKNVPPDRLECCSSYHYGLTNPRAVTPLGRRDKWVPGTLTMTRHGWLVYGRQASDIHAVEFMFDHGEGAWLARDHSPDEGVSMWWPADQFRGE